MSSQARPAIVFGATGLTGRHVVELLAKQGTPVIAHVRPDSARLAEWTARFTALGAQVSSAPWTRDGIAALLAAEKPALVFGLLGTTQARVKQAAKAGRDASKETYDAVDVGLTELTIAACRALEPRPRFVYLSSVGTSETAAGSYLQARARVERTLRESGVPYTIARPSFIVGERDEPRALEKLSAPLVDGLLGVLGAVGARSVRDRYRSITGQHLARALVTLALDPVWKDRVAEPADLRV